MARPWDVVRRWSQRVWDSVEKRQLAWGDDQQIQNLRVSIAISGSSRSGHPPPTSDTRSAKSEVITLGTAAGTAHTTTMHRSNISTFVHFVTHWADTARVTMWSDAITKPSIPASLDPSLKWVLTLSRSRGLTNKNPTSGGHSSSLHHINSFPRFQKMDIRRPCTHGARRAACHPNTCWC